MELHFCWSSLSLSHLVTVTLSCSNPLIWFFFFFKICDWCQWNITVCKNKQLPSDRLAGINVCSASCAKWWHGSYFLFTLIDKRAPSLSFMCSTTKSKMLMKLKRRKIQMHIHYWNMAAVSSLIWLFIHLICNLKWPCQMTKQQFCHWIVRCHFHSVLLWDYSSILSFFPAKREQEGKVGAGRY